VVAYSFYTGIWTTYNYMDNASPPPHTRPTTLRPRHAPTHTARMHHAIIWIHTNRTSAETLVTHCAVSVFVDDHSAVQTARNNSAVASDLAFAEQDCFDDGCLFYAAQFCDDAFFVEDRVGVTYATAEVRFEVFDGKAWGDEIECRGGW
jgi:hypothetical protein